MSTYEYTQQKGIALAMDRGLLPFEQESLEEYLKLLYKHGVKVTGIRKLGENQDRMSEKLGFDTPLLISFTHGHEREQIVLHTIHKDGQNHEQHTEWPRNLLTHHEVCGEMPHPVHSSAFAAFAPKEKLLSLEEDNEFFLITPYVSGEVYARDLCQIADTQSLRGIDEDRVVAIAEHLAEIHAVKKSDRVLYQRRIHHILGRGKSLMRILESYYSEEALISPEHLEEIEKQCAAWRLRSKDFHHRLSHVHGDFHPWNVQFQQNSASLLLDCSRGQWGEPANDVSAMTINYILFSLRKTGALTRPFQRLYNLFWARYLDVSGDQEILRIIQPFYAWQVLAVTSPVWHSSLSLSVRKMLFRFVKNMLASEHFDPERVDDYFG